MSSGEKWMLMWRSAPSSSLIGPSIADREADRGGRRPAAAAVRGRRPALPEADRGSREARAGRMPRGRAGLQAHPEALARDAADRGGPAVRLGVVRARAGGTPPLGHGLVLRGRRAVRPAARIAGQQALARADDAAPPASAGRPARAALPGAQDHRPRALPLLMSRTRELQRLALRLVRLGIVIVGVLFAGTIAFAVSEDLSPWEAFRWSLDIVATV